MRKKKNVMKPILRIALILWIVGLCWFPVFAGSPFAFITTCCFLVVVFLISSFLLLFSGRIVLFSCLVQLPLFCVLNYQLFLVFGSEHYLFENTPVALDWIGLTAAHFFRAVDVIDRLPGRDVLLVAPEHPARLTDAMRRMYESIPDQVDVDGNLVILRSTHGQGLFGEDLEEYQRRVVGFFVDRLRPSATTTAHNLGG